jgi:hypothetical protein
MKDEEEVLKAVRHEGSTRAGLASLAARLDLEVSELTGRRLDRRVRLVGSDVSREAPDPAPDMEAAAPGRAEA